VRGAFRTFVAIQGTEMFQYILWQEVS